MRIAGVNVDPDTYQSFVNIVATPDMPILHPNGSREIPAEDLYGFLIRELGLVRATMTPAQKVALSRFITAYTIE